MDRRCVAAQRSPLLVEWAEEDITVIRPKDAPEQIVRKLREVERLLGAGQTITKAEKQAENARRLRELEARERPAEADRCRQLDALKEQPTRHPVQWMPTNDIQRGLSGEEYNVV